MTFAYLMYSFAGCLAVFLASYHLANRPKRNWQVFLRNWRSYLIAVLAAAIATFTVIGIAASLELYASLQLTIAEKRHDLKQAIVLLNGSFKVNDAAMYATEKKLKLTGE